MEDLIYSPLPEDILYSPRPEDVIYSPMPEDLSHFPVPEDTISTPMSEDSAQTSPKSGFLRLPGELRDEIYGYYFTLEDGYTFNPETNKFVASNYEENRLALSRVNKLIAEETRDAVAKYNDLHFSTVLSSSTNPNLSRINRLLKDMIKDKSTALLDIVTGTEWLSEWLDDEALAHIRDNHARFLPVVEHTRSLSYAEAFRFNLGYKEVPSLTRKFVESTLESILTRPAFQAEVTTEKVFDARRLFCISKAQGFEPWCIPTDAQINRLPNGPIPQYQDAFLRELPQVQCQGMRRYSAVSVAIRYMNSLSEPSRKMIRKIVLHEDDTSIVWPECHAEGLIPFSWENEHLQIERHVNIWRNILVNNHACMPTYSSSTLARWIQEVSVLPHLGMRKDAYTMILNGDPVPESTNPSLASEIFDVAVDDAVWQSSLEKCASTGSDGPFKSIDMRTCPAFIMAGFVETIHDIIDGTSAVKCNFPIKNLADARPVPYGHVHWDLETWWLEWEEQELDNRNIERLRKQGPPYPGCVVLVHYTNLLPFFEGNTARVPIDPNDTETEFAPQIIWPEPESGEELAWWSEIDMEEAEESSEEIMEETAIEQTTTTSNPAPRDVWQPVWQGRRLHQRRVEERAKERQRNRRTRDRQRQAVQLGGAQPYESIERPSEYPAGRSVETAEEKQERLWAKLHAERVYSASNGAPAFGKHALRVQRKEWREEKRRTGRNPWDMRR
ncbi:uncharacterized protein J4E84_006788 [Alternaria hordeiaustralica]|uniref:uncharacterized protein n=1 Tax=Alternaria hordeiaustralica TaxID=1187925 RepID=UPI0020C5699F|nr:uncharacterized protein J4E84_006788 [Alternaria hordeiaustralica]KAI4683948.1 hypothetical protein J4E84_006788 [Alternaria hordeiaustralica]